MNFKTETRQGVTILRMEETRLDSAFAPDLKAELLLYAKQPKPRLLLDMAKVDYTDSSGLGAILFGIRQIRNAHGNLKLVYLQPRVLTLIKIAKLDNVIESYDNEDEAVASFETD
jgi:anti-sigma B factor antagonist